MSKLTVQEQGFADHILTEVRRIFKEELASQPVPSAPVVALAAAAPAKLEVGASTLTFGTAGPAIVAKPASKWFPTAAERKAAKLAKAAAAPAASVPAVVAAPEAVAAASK